MQDFPATQSGFWSLRYIDQDFRVLQTNKDNLFVLRRLPEAASETQGDQVV